MKEIKRHPDHTLLEMLMLDVGLILLNEKISNKKKVSQIKDKHLEVLRKLVPNKKEVS